MARRARFTWSSTPKSPFPESAIKAYTAREANQILGRAGEPFWNETYDHWVRNEDERNRIIRYIEGNPVSAGLIEAIEQWPWSSASR